MSCLREWVAALLALAMLLTGAALAEASEAPILDAPVGELEEFELFREDASVAAPEAAADPAAAVSAQDVPMQAVPMSGVMELTGKDAVTMNAGESLLLSVPGRELKSLKSSRTARVACAADGTITALAEGSAKVTLTTADGAKFKLSVTVVDPYKPSAVSLVPGGELQLTLQDVVTLTPVLSPETARATYTWKSSKSAVVVVDNGVLYPQKEGAATVTVKTQNRKSAKVKVRVVDPYKPDSVALDISGTVTVKPGEVFALTPSVSPATARPVYTWKSSRSAVASVDANGVVTALKKGTAKITVTTQNKKKAQVTVKVAADQAASNDGALPMRMTAARYKYFRKYMSKSEFDQALAVIQSPLEQMLSWSVEDQVYGVWRLAGSFGFDYSMKEKHYNDPYGVLVKGVASCAGTTRTAGFMLNLLGLEYEHVNENKYDHQWNRVNVNGVWWICDSFGGLGYCGPEGDPNMPIEVRDEKGNVVMTYFTYMSDEAYSRYVGSDE
ncbi:MAG: Ig-like domain-containing protein [Clostridia bacterium]|nr:Ig-like domain-containing protein [Clostridia bacterium]